MQDAAFKPYRELTLPAVALGVVIGAVMTAAFVYIALKLGFGLPGSTVAAILGFGILRGIPKLLGRSGETVGSIVENNINQTVASGVNNASAGIAFTLPALFLMAQKDPSLSFSPWPIILSAVGGSFLGIVVIIPLRKQMIEIERLRFPTGIAVATLLKSPGAGARQALLMAGGFAVACAFHVLTNMHVLPEEVNIGEVFGVPAYIPVAVGISFASIGAGLLSGKGGLPFFFGAILAWWILSPIAVGNGWVPTLSQIQEWVPGASQAAYEGAVAGMMYGEILRPVGIGILIGGALSGVVASAPAVMAAVKSLGAAAKAGVGGQDEMPPSVMGFGAVASVLILFAAAYFASDDIGVVRALVIAGVGTVWLALAGLIVAQATGMTDISPISGMSLIGVTLMLVLSGGNAVAAIILGVAVSIGIGQCADMMMDLKSGHLIGATPRKQQMAQFAVSWLGVFVAVGVLYLLWRQGEGGTGGFGPGQALSAPQGAALANVVESLTTAGGVPVEKYAGGALLGLGLGVFPVGGLGVLVGLAMYLPFYITMTYGLGCIAAIVLGRTMSKAWMGHTLVPVAAGFIIGEALTNLGAVLVSLANGGA